MFIGREKELKLLNEQYNKPGFTMTVIYGRRRIGKSTLIGEYIRGKQAIYYTATKVGDDRNLELLSTAVFSELDKTLVSIPFPSLDNLLDVMTSKLPEQKLVFVIDEFPYWAEKNEGLLSVLQKYIDTRWADKNLHLILCGSSLSFMEEKVLSEKSPVFGRRDAQIHLDTFDYLEASEFVPDYSYEDKAICYGITGGVARYLALIDPSKSLDDNIKALFFDPNGYLYDETRNLLTQEFADIALVSNIIEQIASGQNTLKLIADKVHEKEPTVLYSLNKLISVGLIEKRRCMTEEKNRKKIQYVLKDHMFQFWYEFVSRACSVIEIGNGGYYYDNVVRPVLHVYMGRVFEDMCRYFTLREGSSGNLGSFLTRVGSWWGTELLTDENSRKYPQAADIDVVGLSDVDKTMVVGECKFTNQPIDRSVYDTLLRRSRALHSDYDPTRFLLFSLSGFTKWFEENTDLALMKFTLEDLYRQQNNRERG